MDILLTIAIPTYNRVEKLKTCLHRLMEETVAQPVEILVSDNASGDDTRAFMEDFVGAHSEVAYVRNPENVGADRNFLNCYARARGEYVLLLGDDDVLLPGALPHILEALAQKPVFLHLNTSTLLSETPLTYTRPHVPEGETRVYDHPEALFGDMGIFVTFVSSLVMRTDLVRAVPDKEKYVGTYFLQSHVALKTLKTAGKYMFVTRNCVAATGNARVNYDIYYVWGQQYYHLLFTTAVEAGVSREAVEKQHRQDMAGILYGFVRTLRLTSPGSGRWKKSCIMACARKYPSLYPRYFLAVHLPKFCLRAWDALKGRKA